MTAGSRTSGPSRPLLLNYLLLVVLPALAARVTGVAWRDALALGTLMNTRGLMELVILNIGLDLGVLSPALYSMMVLMAFTTTVMTSPLLSALGVTRATAP